jgi:tRNA A-37 threonylcarbamoyl transferase component Bud32
MHTVCPVPVCEAEPVRMSFASGPDPTDLLTLPWSTPLVDWPAEQLISLPRGISRHVVRFAKIGGIVYAVKEVNREVAEREYSLLRALARAGLPVVQAVGVVADRMTPEGEPLDSALVTKHLRFSLPYRALFSRRIDPDLEPKLLDALAELIVRLHLAGFAWGDCSLSNTLFRRDAGALAAYLVDAETGALREHLSDGQRDYDLEIARTNLAGELLDLQAAGLLPDAVDPVDTAESVVARYCLLWDELTQAQILGSDEWERIEQRLRRLNELGYDAAQIEVSEVAGQPQVFVQTQVVEAGHHRRRLQQLTGLSVQENQARRILNDLDTFRAQAVMPGNDVDEDTVARYWMSDVFEPVIEAIPDDQRGKLEDAEIYHEVIEHRWFLSEALGRPVSLDEATTSYVENVLKFRPDEGSLLDTSLMGVGSVDDVEE